MEIIKPFFFVETKLDEEKILAKLERCGRTAYKSEDKITRGSAEKFIRSLIKAGHESVIEHETITVRFICDRGVTHELVRHRVAAYTQESTRYVNYTKRGMQIIKPCFWNEDDNRYKLWKQAVEEAEKYYNTLIAEGATPQEARAVLPHSVKTEICVTMNIREWRHVLKLRTAKPVHPQVRELMLPLLAEFKAKLPSLFDDIEADG